MVYDKLGEKQSSPLVFQPDSLVSEHLIDMLVHGKVESGLLQVVITDLNTKHQQIMLVGWQDGGLSDLTYRLYSALTENGQDTAVMETYFWLFWRGWAGLLDPALVGELAAADDDVLTWVADGRPLRGEQLRKFKTIIVWAFANTVGLWGDTDVWKTGDLAPGHLQLRQMMDAYIEKRMVTLHGENYQDAESE